MQQQVLVPAHRLQEFGQAVFEKVGVFPQHARQTAEILVDANLRGIDTHGIYLSSLYARRLQKKLFNPEPDFHFEKRRAGVGVLDADFSLGQPATLEATRQAVKMAKDAGVGIVAVKNSNHFGAAAYYANYMAEQGCIGLVMCDGECDVIPFGGKEKFLGTNPICCSVPSGEKPWFCMNCPLPPQREHVLREVPGAAPEPEQASHWTRCARVSSRSTPCTASRNETDKS